MAAFNFYLNFMGNTEEAFNFYKSVFGGEFKVLMRFKDTPQATQMNDEDKEKIMHIALPIGNGNILMATDALESFGQSLTFGNNMSICISPDSEADTERLFNALSDGGTVLMVLEKQFWGHTLVRQQISLAYSGW